MAALAKRKQPLDEVAVKANKRLKAGEKSKAVKPLEAQPKSTRPTTSSVLSKDQPAFPRGGAGLLTPLERKQISARAAQDVLAEQSKQGDLFTHTRRLENDSDHEETDPMQDDESKVQRKKKRSRQRKVKGSVDKESTISIEGLSYKRLAVGSLILGRIQSINNDDLTIALPNNLSGFVPLTSISSEFNAKLEKSLQQENVDDEKDGTEEKTDIDLKSHFQVGQYLRVAVVSLGADNQGSEPAKKKINLSIDPRQTNTGLTTSKLTTGCTVQGSVTSVEDHGVVLALGMGDDEENVKGFLPLKALSPAQPLSDIQTGSVILCTVQGLGSNGKIVKLSADLQRTTLLKNAPSVDSFLPGVQVEVLISDVLSDGIIGKVMGLIDATADIVHSGSYVDRETFIGKYSIGQKIKGRLICTFPHSETKKIGVSFLEHISTAVPGSELSAARPSLPISSIISSARVVRVAPGLGIYLSLPQNAFGFAHISRLSNKKVEAVSETTGPYKLNSEHKVRTLDFNSTDGLYILSLQEKVIAQPFLRIDDVVIGGQVKATVEKVLVGPTGVQGIILMLAEGITGLVPSMHLSDSTLVHPERKFKEGQSLTARVLSVNGDRRQIRLTLKKTLLNSDQKIWSDFEGIAPGDSTVGTLVKVDPHGALVQFFGDVRGFLPVSEMSEAYIKDATEHFKIGQVLTVNALSVNAENERLTLSCRDRGDSVETSLASISPGSLVSGIVFEKSQKDVLIRLDDTDIIARLALEHTSDGSESKRRSSLEKLRVGQKLEELLVLDVLRKGRLVILSKRQSLIKAAQKGQLLKSWEDLKEDAIVTGYVSNITEAGLFIRYANGISGLVPQNQVPVDAEKDNDFGLTLFQAVTARVLKIDYRGATPRFWLTMRQEEKASLSHNSRENPNTTMEIPQIVQPVDESISSFAEFVLGRVTKARITSIKDTQVNVELAKDVQGRIDMSEIFDAWEDIKDRKQPLKSFYPKQVLTVRILGAHDTRNHRFLPLSHRSSKNTVFELSAKPSTLQTSDLSILSLSDMQKGSPYIAYVNNVAQDCLMVNISPSVRGRIRAIDISDDLSLATDLASNFPIGSALKVKVSSIDLERNHLDLTGKSSESASPLTIDQLSTGTILPGRITKISDRSLIVQMSENLVGAVELIDLADDYALADIARYQKNDVIRVCVVKVDVPNKKVALSTRPSKVLSSSMKVTDPEIMSIDQLEINTIIRGFVSNVSDKGLFVVLGHGITAFVRVTNLSDTYLKSWKDSFQRDQLVKGKIIALDTASGQVQLSLKESVVSGIYKAPLTFTSLEVGDIVTGKVVKVETFGVFILVDNSENVRGLCHRSEIAEQRIEDASKLFNQGDVVKAKVLKLDLPNRRINFGMKASYLTVGDQDEEMHDLSDSSKASHLDSESDASSEGGIAIQEASEAESSASDRGIDIELKQGIDVSDTLSEDDGDFDLASISTRQPAGLSVGGFDWHGISTDNTTAKTLDALDSKTDSDKQRKKKRKPEIQIDRTGDLDANGPQSTDDFERLLLGESDSSLLWIQYMAFHLELGDIAVARQIGERALKTIGIGQDMEKSNVWIALLNLENVYGDEETVEAVFKRALEYNEPQEIYNKLISIYIQSGKTEKADNLFQEMLKKFTQDPRGYVNYATFLFDTMDDTERGRAQLTRALQILPKFAHFELISKFAQLEFKSSNGLPERGRTIFEGLLSSFPKRMDLFNVLLDLEMKQGDHDVIRDLFERIFDKKLKPKQAKYFFKRWLAFEEAQGDERRIEDVKAKAATWVKSQE